EKLAPVGKQYILQKTSFLAQEFLEERFRRQTARYIYLSTATLCGVAIIFFTGIPTQLRLWITATIFVGVSFYILSIFLLNSMKITRFYLDNREEIKAKSKVKDIFALYLQQQFGKSFHTYNSVKELNILEVELDKLLPSSEEFIDEIKPYVQKKIVVLAFFSMVYFCSLQGVLKPIFTKEAKLTSTVELYYKPFSLPFKTLNSNFK
ncbi:MAG: hypothetical protein ACPHXR_08925, partial [Flavicella sp.]